MGCLTMRLIPIECVKEGTYLAKTIFDNEGRPLLREGAKLSNKIIEKIKSIQVYSLYIIDEYSDMEIDDIIKPELRQKAITSVKETFSSLDKFSKSSPSKYSNKLIKERELYFESIYDVAEELLDQILSDNHVMVHLVDIKSLDNYTYQHCVNVAVLSLILGIQLQLNKYDLLDLCIGALVHDIGKSFIPTTLLFKEGPLTKDELLIMKTHTTLGYDYLRNISGISAKSRIISLQHHEWYDGTGYPENRRGEEINKFSRIVSIADVYDALTSDRPYRRALSPNEAIEYIMANSSTQFDYEIVKAFSRIIVPYSKGTLVKLSNGDIAVVEDTLPNFPLRPNIKIVKSSDPSRNGLKIKLVKSLSLVIENIQYTI